jgi:hypothetical protein
LDKGFDISGQSIPGDLEIITVSFEFHPELSQMFDFGLIQRHKVPAHNVHLLQERHLSSELRDGGFMLLS